MVITVPMADAVGVNAAAIPTSMPKVAGYVTGSGYVPWSLADWGRFPAAGHVRIDQSPGGTNPLGADVLDVEAGAAAAGDVPGWVKTRMDHGITWSTIYAGDAVLAQCQQALINAEAQYGRGWYFGHVDCWYANWNASQSEAVSLVGTEIHGLTCRAVQWASPTSNPDTICPGTNQTLAHLQIDLSEAEATWHMPPTPGPSPAEEVKRLAAIVSTDIGRLLTAVSKL